jgi:hypothetical protein
MATLWTSPLTQDIPCYRASDPGNAHQNANQPLAAGVTVYGGSVATTNSSGFLVLPSVPSSNLTVWGIISRYATNPGTNTGTVSGVTAEILTGTFFLSSGTAGDLLSQGTNGTSVYLINEFTVGATSGGSTRPIAGTQRFVDTTRFGDQFAIALGTAAPGTGVGP